MDPFAALSLAGTIVQFVDFSSKMVSSGLELYQSSTGALEINDQIDLVATDLSALVRKLRHEQNINDAFEKICEEATKIANELLVRLGKLRVKGKHRAWDSMQQALKNVWSKEEVTSLLARLSTIREALGTHILASLRYKCLKGSI
jgi:hypothetical protein